MNRMRPGLHPVFLMAFVSARSVPADPERNGLPAATVLAAAVPEDAVLAVAEVPLRYSQR